MFKWEDLLVEIEKVMEMKPPLLRLVTRKWEKRHNFGWRGGKQSWLKTNGEGGTLFFRAKRIFYAWGIW
jgi:hypothetical protein